MRAWIRLWSFLAVAWTKYQDGRQQRRALAARRLTAARQHPIDRFEPLVVLNADPAAVGSPGTELEFAL